MRIYKYPMVITDKQTILMPKDAVILDIQIQDQQLVLWAIVNPGNEIEIRHFNIYGTGHEIDSEVSKQYIGTYKLFNGDLVFHVFEIF